MWQDDILMYMATACYLMCYVPTVYADFKNANCNVYNLPERILSVMGTALGLAFGLRINNTSIVVNYGCHIGLEVLTLVIKGYYASKNGWSVTGPVTGPVMDAEPEPTPDPTPEELVGTLNNDAAEATSLPTRVMPRRI